MLATIKQMLYIPSNKLLIGSSIYFFVFISYLEISPKLGNIWLRKDDMGIKRFHPSSILKLIIKPLYSIMYWNPLIWDINFYIGAYIFSKTLYYLNLI
tara:strand:+ start:237 stop:530 length:294 start_codon:yes stop_codon:yes gene_type:complete